MFQNLKRNSGSDAPVTGLLLAFLLLLAPAGIRAQIELKQYTSATDTFYWKRYTHVKKPPEVSLGRFCVSGRNKAVRNFLANPPEEYRFPGGDTLSPARYAGMARFLFPVEVSGDRLPDMIFSGPADSSGRTIVRIWLNTGLGYRQVFEDYRYISGWSFAKNKRLLSLETGEEGPEENPVLYTRSYRVEYAENEPQFIREKQTLVYRYTEEPGVVLGSPAPFRSVSDSLLLRASGARLNEPFIPQLGTFGNIVARYRERTTGRVLGHRSLIQGAPEWYYVEIWPSARPSASIFEDTRQMPSFIRGWVSAKAIRMD